MVIDVGTDSYVFADGNASNTLTTVIKLSGVLGAAVAFGDFTA